MRGNIATASETQSHMRRVEARLDDAVVPLASRFLPVRATQVAKPQVMGVRCGPPDAAGQPSELTTTPSWLRFQRIILFSCRLLQCVHIDLWQTIAVPKEDSHIAI
jgi:hypothetical protein